MMNLSAKAKNALAASIAATVLLAGVFGLITLLRQETPAVLERIRQGGTLVVATRRAPSTYHDGANGPDGFEYALVQAFARHLNVQPRFVFPHTLEELLDATIRGSVHLAAAGLTITPSREKHLAFSLPYRYVTEQVIYRRGSRRPRSLSEVGPDDLHVVAHSSHEETLRHLNATQFPSLSWQRHPGISTAAPAVGIGTGQSSTDRGRLRRHCIVSSRIHTRGNRVRTGRASADRVGLQQDRR